jgi:hypothetical protein
MTRHLSPGWKGLFLGAFLGVLAMGVPGCSRSAKVSGTVKYQGKLLTSGNVIFVDQDNKATPPALIHPDGTYLAPSVPVGSMTILINAPPPDPPETDDEDSPEYKKYDAKMATYVPIPERYMDLKESGKTFGVKSGSNVCDIDLE